MYVRYTRDEYFALRIILLLKDLYFYFPLVPCQLIFKSEEDIIAKRR